MLPQVAGGLRLFRSLRTRPEETRRVPEGLPDIVNFVHFVSIYGEKWTTGRFYFVSFVSSLFSLFRSFRTPPLHPGLRVLGG